MIDQDRVEMLELFRHFREAMTREIDEPTFDNEARVRIGEILGYAARQGQADYAVLRG
jgi:hypothetical protein